MFDSLYIATTGMLAQQSNIDSIANNLANVNTPTYKKNRISFDDLVYMKDVQGARPMDQALKTMEAGMGTAIMDSAKVFTTGDLRPSQNPMDLAIRGNGFFEVELANGNKAYTRLGSLSVGENGYLETRNGYRLADKIQVPADATSLTFAENGTVTAIVGEKQEAVEIGKLKLFNFTNSSALIASGENLYLANEAAGVPLISKPGDDGIGTIVQGYVEASNVDLVEELTELVLAQRAYEVNSQIVRVTDEMLQINNNLRR